MDMEDVGIVILISLLLLLVGIFITYPPYAKLSALLFLVLGLGVLALRESEVESIGKEGLEGKTGKGPEAPAEEGGKVKGEKKKRKGKKTEKSKRKGKKKR